MQTPPIRPSQPLHSPAEQPSASLERKAAASLMLKLSSLLSHIPFPPTK